MPETFPFLEGTVIRPPSEADSLILQVTLGCSDNRCIFCPAYKDKPFRVKEPRQIELEIEQYAGRFPGTRRIFLADGDALVMPQKKLINVLTLLKERFPKLSRVAAYGSIKSLEGKLEKELAELKELGLAMIYIGFETGDDEVYLITRKYGSPAGNVKTCLKVKNAGIRTNVTVIAGLGGKKFSKKHAVNTAGILNAARPDQIAVLTLMLAPGTPLFDMKERGEFQELDPFEMIGETKTLIENMDEFRCQFFSNHASSYFPVAARFPRDKNTVIKSLNLVLRDRSRARLTPDFLRGL